MKQNLWLAAAGCIIALSSLAGCGTRAELPRHIGASLDGIASKTESRQLLYVDPGTPGRPQAFLYPVRHSLTGWEQALPPVAVNLGRNGVAPPFEKREGDGRTPSGIFPLTRAFGSLPAIAGSFSYRQVDAQDLWVDDAHSPDYNRWVARGATKAASFEELLRPDPLYRYAIAVDYNSEPVVLGMGSAIFIHVERAPGAQTAGCVSMPEADLVQVMQWLDPEKRPQVVIGTPTAVAVAASGVKGVLPADLPPVLRQRLSEGGRLLALRQGSGFFAAAVTLPPEVSTRMQEKGVWRPECPVPLQELAYLVTSFWGFDGARHYGELVVHQALAAFFMDALQHGYNGRFPIERMELIDAFDADDFRSMAANNSSAFNCREVPGRAGVFSRHSHGAALDINPLQNPYLMLEEAGREKAARVDGGVAALEFCLGNPAVCRVLPAASAPYLARGERLPGMLQPGDPLLAAFKERGFTWGGSWRFPDYQHIEFDPAKLPLP